MSEQTQIDGYRDVHFDIQGEFITNLVREQFFYEGKSYEHVLELLLSCMEGTDQSKEELTRLAEDVLLGRAAFTGNTRDNTYGMEVYEPEEQPDIPESFHVFRKLSSLTEELKETKAELRKMQDWYCVAMEQVPEYRRNIVLRETDQPIACSYRDSVNTCSSRLLSSYMERALDGNEHTTEDYGWLQPDGTFHEVDWGNHQEWASDYVQEHFPEEFMNNGLQANTNTGLIGDADWLVEQGWVLLHSPAQGIAEPTRNPVKRYTKAQREFLFDYYTERGRTNEANAIYADE